MKTNKPITSEGMQTVKSLPSGEYFKRNEAGAQVWVRGPYCPSNRGYECTRADDISQGRYFKGSTAVFVGFTY